MVFSSLSRGIERWARPLSSVMSTIGSLALLLMMMWVVVDVAMRFLFNRPVLGSYEVVEYMMVAFVFMAFAYAQFCKTHITVPVVVERLSPRIRAVLDSFTSLVTLVMGSIMVWGAGKQSLEMWNNHMTSSVLYIPKWPFQLITAIGLTAFTIAVLSDVFANLYRALTGKAVQQQSGEDLRAI